MQNFQSLVEPQIPAAFADNVAYCLRLAQEASFAAFRQGTGKTEVKPGWYTILTILADNPGLTPSELSSLCGRDRSTLTTTLKELAHRGLVARRRKREDQRSYTIKLTAAGERVQGNMRIIARKHDAKLDKIVGTDKASLIVMLRTIATELARQRVAPQSSMPRLPCKCAPPKAAAPTVRSAKLKA